MNWVPVSGGPTLSQGLRTSSGLLGQDQSQAVFLSWMEEELLMSPLGYL